MGAKARLLILVALAAVAVLVWQLAARGSPPRERAGRAPSARGEAESEPAPPVAPAPEAGAAEGTATAAPPAEGIRVRVLAEGRPVADARVYAMAGDEMNILAREPEGTWFAGVTGDLTLGAVHARYGPVRKKVRAGKGAITDATLELPAGATLDVLVVADRGSAPVAGASVYVLRAGGKDLDGGNTGLEDLFEGDDPAKGDLSLLGTLDVSDFVQLGGLPAVAIPKLLTDAAGRARIGGLPRGTVDIVVSHPDFVPARLRNRPVGEEAVARLSAGGSLTVLAPYVDGRAAEGYVCGAIRPGLMLSMPVGSAPVDAEGKAFFPHLPPGPLKILVAKVKHPLEMMGAAMGGMVAVTVKAKEPGEEEPVAEEEPQPKQLAGGNVTIVSGEHRTLDLREAKGTRIEGIFVAGTEPRADATVLLLSGEEFRQQVGAQQTDAEGKFGFEGVAPGRYRVVAATGDAGGIARADCEAKEGDEVVSVRLELPVGAIAGRILGADGKPAKGARVFVVPRDRPPGQASSLGELMEQLAGVAGADEEGRFRVQGIAPGEYRVLGSAGRRLDVVPATVREGEDAQVELRMDDALVRRLLARLEGEGGKPVEGTVTVLGGDGGSAEMLALTEDEEMGGNGKASATHEFFLAPGRYRLVARAPGLAPALGEAVEIAGDREVTLRLGPGVRVELTFEGPAGPLANREVEVRNEAGIRLGSRTPIEMLLGGQGYRTDGGGVLALDAVPPGRYVLLVDGKERGRVDVASMPVAKRVRVE